MALKSLVLPIPTEYEYVDCDGTDRKFIKKLYVLPVPSEELKNNH